MLKLVTLLVLIVCTVVGARSCSRSSPSSPLNPLNVARNGLNGVCANQQAVADAGGAGRAGPTVPPAVQQQLGALVGGSFSCPTTTADTQP
jgi:hypothetical protein